MFNSGYEAARSLNIPKGHVLDLWYHEHYNIENFSDLSYQIGLKHIVVRNDMGGTTIIESKNNKSFGRDLSELGKCRIFTDKNEAEKSWLFLLDSIKTQFKKIIKAQGFKSRKKHPEKYI